MRTNTRVAVLAASLLALTGAPASAQNSYGSAASVAASLGATASPPVARGPFLVPREPSAAPQDVPTTGAIVRHDRRAGARAHRR